MAFEKQVSREQYHEAFIKKQEDHKVDANVYNAQFSQTRERAKIAILGPESVKETRNKRQMQQSVNVLVDRSAYDSINKSAQDEDSPEIRKLKKTFSKRTMRSGHRVNSQDDLRMMNKNDSKLSIEEDGQIVYEGDLNNLDALFPPDGVIRIKQAPPQIEGESPDRVKDLVKMHNVPIKKQRVLLKPKKHKLPATVNILDEETFSDVIYDSDEEAKKKSKKNGPKK